MKHAELLDDTASLDRGADFLDIFRDCAAGWEATVHARTLEEIVAEQVELLRLTGAESANNTKENLAVFGSKVLETYMLQQDSADYSRAWSEIMAPITTELERLHNRPVAIQTLSGKLAIISRTGHEGDFWQKQSWPKTAAGFIINSYRTALNSFYVTRKPVAEDLPRKHIQVYPLTEAGEPQIRLAIGD